jgi:nicotinamide-nucleotide amidase
MISDRQLTTFARRVFRRLQTGNTKIVLAESCTGGLVSAVLTLIPGISEFHCGSAVVYQVATKAAWLGVPRSLLRDPGPVSEEVASRMVLGALRITPHADVAAAVTGHLGPGAPKDQDGIVYVAFARRDKGQTRGGPVVRKLDLAKEPGDRIKNEERRRLRRQRSAAASVLSLILEELSRGK